MSDDSKRSRQTYQDVVDAPPHLVAELIDGVLYTSPRPFPPHTHVSSALGIKLGAPFQFGENGPGGWYIYDEPELHLGEDVLIPDLAGWKRGRLSRDHEGQGFEEQYLELAPDWVCEVLSKSTAGHDRTHKRPIYAREGVPFLWFVDPRRESIELHRLEGQHYRLVETFEGRGRVRIEPFDAIELDIGKLW